MLKSFKGSIVQINVGYFHLAARQTVHINNKSMVLRSDLDSTVGQILHWMIGAMVAEFQLGGLSP